MYPRQAAAGGRFVNSQNCSRLTQTKPVEIIQLDQQSILGVKFSERLPQGLLNIGGSQLAGQGFLGIWRGVEEVEGVLLAIGIACQSIQISVFFGLNETRLAAMLIDRQLAHDRAQPSAQRTRARIVRQLTR